MSPPEIAESVRRTVARGLHRLAYWLNRTGWWLTEREYRQAKAAAIAELRAREQVDGSGSGVSGE